MQTPFANPMSANNNCKLSSYTNLNTAVGGGLDNNNTSTQQQDNAVNETISRILLNYLGTAMSGIGGDNSNSNYNNNNHNNDNHSCLRLLSSNLNSNNSLNNSPYSYLGGVPAASPSAAIQLPAQQHNQEEDEKQAVLNATLLALTSSIALSQQVMGNLDIPRNNSSGAAPKNPAVVTPPTLPLQQLLQLPGSTTQTTSQQTFNNNNLNMALGASTTRDTDNNDNIQSVINALSDALQQQQTQTQPPLNMDVLIGNNNNNNNTTDAIQQLLQQTILQQHQSNDAVRSMNNNHDNHKQQLQMHQLGNMMTTSTSTTSSTNDLNNDSSFMDTNPTSSHPNNDSPATTTSAVPVSSDEENNDTAISAAATSNHPSSVFDKQQKGRPAIFIKQLYEMLTDLHEKQPKVACFLPHGKAFIIHKPEVLVKEILPKYQFKMKSISSFKRQLNMYGFRQVSIGADKGSYFHERFINQKPELLKSIKRVVTIKNKALMVPH